MLKGSFHTQEGTGFYHCNRRLFIDQAVDVFDAKTKRTNMGSQIIAAEAVRVFCRSAAG